MTGKIIEVYNNFEHNDIFFTSKNKDMSCEIHIKNIGTFYGTIMEISSTGKYKIKVNGKVE